MSIVYFRFEPLNFGNANSMNCLIVLVFSEQRLIKQYQLTFCDPRDKIEPWTELGDLCDKM